MGRLFGNTPWVLAKLCSSVTALHLFPVPLPGKGTAVAEDKSRRVSHASTVALNVTPFIHTKMLFGGKKKKKILHKSHLVLFP